MKRRLAFLFTFVVAVSPLYSQTAVWKNFTSMYDINGVAVAGGKVWGATTGGVFSYIPGTTNFVEYTTTEGLSNIQATAIAADSGTFVLVGEEDGSIDELDSSGSVVRSQLDIAKSSLISKQIISLSLAGDTVFACTPFGVVLVSRSTFGILDTYSHFDAAQGSIQANSAAVFANTIYVGSQFGLSYAPRSAINLAAPDLWKLSDTLGLNSGVNALEIFAGSLFVGTQQGLFYTTDGKTFHQYSGSPAGAVYSLALGSNYMLINSASGLYKMSAAGSFTALYTGGASLSGIAAYSDVMAVAATSNGLLTVGSTASFVFPPGPGTNSVSDLAVDSSGNLWCSASASGVGVAFMKFDGTSWKNFSMANTPQLSTNSFYKISAVGGDKIAVGSWGAPGPSTAYRGEMALVDHDSVRVFDGTNAPFYGIPKDNKYILVGSAVSDPSGNIWVTNPTSYINNPIAVYSPSENKWYSFHNALSPVSGFAPISIDAYGGIWTGDQYGQPSSAGSFSGLLYYNANGTLDNTSDDQSYILNQGNAGLLSNNVNAVLVDNEDQVWIGTSLGMDVIYDPDPAGSLSVQSIYSLLDQNINSIDYDALDQKWVATNTGVYVISRDGNTPITSYNTANSPLPNNQVLAVACDRSNGIVYFATVDGITELKTGVKQPEANFSKLKIFPDPARVPLSQPIHIEGLVASSEIKVFTIDGRLVTQFQAQGGKVAYWNGTDLTGKLLPTGIYIVVAYSSDGSQSLVSKIALIHR